MGENFSDLLSTLDKAHTPFDLFVENPIYTWPSSVVKHLDMMEHLIRFSPFLVCLTAPKGGGKRSLLNELLTRLGDNTEALQLNGELLSQPVDWVSAIAENFGQGMGVFSNDQFPVLKSTKKLRLIVVENADKLSANMLERLLVLLHNKPERIKLAWVFMGEPVFHENLGSVFAEKAEQWCHWFDIPAWQLEETQYYLEQVWDYANSQVNSPLGPFPLTEKQCLQVHRQSNGLPGRVLGCASKLMSASDSTPSAKKTFSWPLLSVAKFFQNAFSHKPSTSILKKLLLPIKYCNSFFKTGIKWASIPIVIVVFVGFFVFLQEDSNVNNIKTTTLTLDALKPDTLTPDTLTPDTLTIGKNNLDLPDKMAITTVSDINENILVEQQALRFSLQLMGSHSDTRVSEFMGALDLSGSEVFMLETTHEGQPWYIALYGRFDNREEAQASLNDLSVNLQALKPWVRAEREPYEYDIQ